MKDPKVTMRARDEENDAVTAYWLEHYTLDGQCGLCHNTGVLHSHNLRTYCICPNGQSMRYHEVPI